ncbi:MAG: hypothetical protein ACXVFQ_23160, partial [Solirubrobacteraceae bacterium]
MHLGRLTGIVVGVALAVPASALAVSFGLPLGTAPFNVAPNYPYDCSVIYNPFLGQPLTFPDPTGTRPASSCIWADVPTPAEFQAAHGRNISLAPPGTGTVTQVQVAVGPRTGPMQVVVMRALYRNTTTPGKPEDACCFPTARSQRFVPRANAITSVRVDLPVKEDATPPADDITTIADFDTIALAVLQPGVPVPLYYTGDASQPADFVWNTSTPSTVTPGFTTDTGGFFVALGAQWTAGGGGGSGGPVGLPRGNVPVSNGNAQVPLRCLANAQCAGQLLLQSGAATTARDTIGTAAGRAFAARIATYGSA